MNFSDSQLVFAVAVFVIFIIFIGLAYRKDFKRTPAYFKGTWKVLLAIVVIFGVFYLTVKLFG